MKPIATPAYRPTADSIWNSFLTSGKRHLILTGSRGVGKTTRLKALCAGMPGMVTRAVPKEGVYMRAHPAGEEVQVGFYDPTLPGMENKMRPCPGAFEERAVPMVTALTEAPGEWAFVDEIGYLESGSEPYMAALRALFDRKRVIAAVRRQDTPFLMEMRSRADAFCVDLDAPFGLLGCVIMASGLSRRFGGNKLTADFLGQPMIQRVLAATEGMFHRRVVVTRHEEITDLCRAQGIEAILHDLPLRSDTVRLGIEAMADVDGCMFCPADQPLLRRETAASLAMCAAGDPQSIWRPCFGENPGSPVVFPRWAFDGLRSLPEGKGGAYVARQHPERVRMLQVADGHELMDADDREAFELLLKIASQPQG